MQSEWSNLSHFCKSDNEEDSKKDSKEIHNLCDEYAKDEIEQMIWEVDENSDGYVSENEFTNMYKKCIFAFF